MRRFLGGKGVSLLAGVGGIGLASAVYSAGYVILPWFLTVREAESLIAKYDVRILEQEGADLITKP